MTGAVSLLKYFAADLFKYVLAWSTRTCLSWRVTSLFTRLSLLSKRRQLWATQLVTGMMGIAVVCTVPFPHLFFPFLYLPFLSLCLSSCVSSWTLHFPGQCWSRILEGIPVVFLRLQPERISERIVEQIVGCSISRRIEQFIAT